VFDGARWACPARGLKAPEWKDAGPVLIGLEDGDARGDQPSTLNAIGGFWCCTLWILLKNRWLLFDGSARSWGSQSLEPKVGAVQ